MPDDTDINIHTSLRSLLFNNEQAWPRISTSRWGRKTMPKCVSWQEPSFKISWSQYWTEKNAGLYRYDGLSILKGTSGPAADQPPKIINIGTAWVEDHNWGKPESHELVTVQYSYYINYTLDIALWCLHLIEHCCWGAFVVCIALSSAPWCFEHCGIGRWFIQTSGRWSVVLKSRIWSHPGGDKYSLSHELVHQHHYMNPSDGTYCPYLVKPNSTPMYVNVKSNHQLQVIKKALLGINRRLCTNPCNEQAFDRMQNRSTRIPSRPAGTRPPHSSLKATLPAP